MHRENERLAAELERVCKVIEVRDELIDAAISEVAPIVGVRQEVHGGRRSPGPLVPPPPEPAARQA